MTATKASRKHESDPHQFEVEIRRRGEFQIAALGDRDYGSQEYRTPCNAGTWTWIFFPSADSKAAAETGRKRPQTEKKINPSHTPDSPAEQDREEDFSTEVHEEDFTARNPILKPTKLSDCISSLRGQLVGTASKEAVLNLLFPKITDMDPETLCSSN